MATVLEGESATVNVPDDKALTVTTTGEANVAQGSRSSRLLVGDTLRQFPEVAFSVSIHAVTGNATYTVAYPLVPGSDVSFRRNDAGDIDALIDPESGEAATLGGGSSVPVVGTVGDVVDIIGADDPVAAEQSIFFSDPDGDDNALTFTAVAYGEVGNNISVEYVDPAANDATLSVVVVDTAITVNLATGVAGAITSTAALIKAAIEASGPATALVTVEINTFDTGVADDGSGVVTAMALTNLSGGTDATGAGVAGTGSRYTNTTAGTLFINTGTKATPVWTQLVPVV